MLKCTVSIDGYDHILGNCRARKWSPLDGDHRHLLLHFGVQNESLFPGKHVINSNGTIKCALGQVLISWIEANIECLGVKITHGPLVRYLDGRVLDALKCELFGHGDEVLFLLLVLFLHHGLKGVSFLKIIKNINSVTFI